MKVRIPVLDLHIHTTVSDGTDTPEALLAHVKKAGIGLFSVTDHDAIEGCRRILAIRTEDDPVFIAGIEFSCRDEEGQYHILGYGYDPDAKAINAVVKKGHAFRMWKVTGRLDFLKERFGFTRLVVFGDGLNDIPMFNVADESYAVANALEEVKRIATGVIGSNEEDAVAGFLKKRMEIQ